MLIVKLRYTAHRAEYIQNHLLVLIENFHLFGANIQNKYSKNKIKGNLTILTLHSDWRSDDYYKLYISLHIAIKLKC